MGFDRIGSVSEARKSRVTVHRDLSVFVKWGVWSGGPASGRVARFLGEFPLGSGRRGGCPVRCGFWSRSRFWSPGPGSGFVSACACGVVPVLWRPRPGWAGGVRGVPSRPVWGGWFVRGGAAKPIRAWGGCLWRREAEGRGGPRESRGSRRAGVDPGVPEPTGGTETSQYPQEGKETSTPSVAASERGRAQTRGATPGGSRTAGRTGGGSGTARNRRRDRVRAPYA